MDSLSILYFVLSLMALLVCAFFSSAEIGFIKLQRFRLKHLEEEGVQGADRVARIMEHPEKFLSTVLTGISFAETIVVSLF
jgi:Mg2+/Co2+ transporter CorB